MRIVAASATVSVLALAAPALAGTDVLYAPTPDWVAVAQIDPEQVQNGPSQLLYDFQHRLESGLVHSYEDKAIRLDDPDELTSQGTLRLTWLPDKGDLTIHRLEIHRDGEVRDLIGEGLEFEVIRRERRLEQRFLDGQLTATVAVPDLRVGDVLRIASSTTLADQALGEEVQVTQFLPSEPWRVGYARAMVSWPQDADIGWRAGPDVTLPEPEVRHGYRMLSVELPLAEREEMPGDAPSRYRRPPFLRVGSFDSWNELSRVMAPHFLEAAVIDPGSEVADQVVLIAAETEDPLARAALATQLVQDEVSYLLKGLDGGNYLPQDAEETWRLRYGDCKAKSVLLLSLLHELGIDADVVLVASRGGDALPDLLPLPANFDHMIVRATIDGTEYWLDGTSSATRLSNIGDVPGFHYALPLSTDGAGLVPMVQRIQAVPVMAIHARVDHSAGIDLPYLFEIEVEMSGPAGARMRSTAIDQDPEMLSQIGRSFGSGMISGAQVTDVSLSYDEDAALGVIKVEGVAPPDFEFERGKVFMRLESGLGGTAFNPNRAKPAWRDIPVATFGPSLVRMSGIYTIPQGGKGYELVGESELEAEFANTRVTRRASIEADRLETWESIHRALGEIPVGQLSGEKRAARRFAAQSLRLYAPADIQWRWDLDDRERARRTRNALARYDKAVEEAKDDDFAPLQARAGFFELIYDFERALADYDRIIEHEPSALLYASRARVLRSLGHMDRAITDLAVAYDINPENHLAIELARIQGREGETEAAMELLDSLPASEEDLDSLADARAEIFALRGNLDDGLKTIAEELADRSQSADLLNSDCWYRGLYKVALDNALDQCIKAVERAANPAPSLDSRALVHFRLGRYDEALSDLDEALRMSPGQSASRYLRGLVRLAKGDDGGTNDIETALRQTPYLKRYYSRYDLGLGN